MAKNYNDQSYFENRPDIVKIFDDLEEFKDFCRMEMLTFNEADLYKRESRSWRFFEKNKKNKKFGGERRPYLGNKPQYNRNDSFSR